ncbi:MAG: hypothetical protein HY819_02760 [Acidobacteria bacterium]|nr:hypothetical protein [Acidobacteriota bacterium]
MNIRKIHRIIGLILLLPFFGWAITGLIFFIKPGYKGAYEILAPKLYPLTEPISINPLSEWLELRCFKTALGNHLIVRTSKGWLHLDPQTLKEKTPPTDDEIRVLLTDAFLANPERYGHISAISKDSIKTDTGINISLDWNRLSLQQTGKDTEWIDTFYKIHYLQWTSISSLDRPIGLVGVLLVILLSVLGVFLAIKKPS